MQQQRSRIIFEQNSKSKTGVMIEPSILQASSGCFLKTFAVISSYTSFYSNFRKQCGKGVGKGSKY